MADAYPERNYHESKEKYKVYFGAHLVDRNGSAATAAAADCDTGHAVYARPDTGVECASDGICAGCLSVSSCFLDQ